MRRRNSSYLTNRTEYDSFVKNALAIAGSITPVIFNRVVFTSLYAAGITLLVQQVPGLALDSDPFEFAGIVLGVILVFRLNAGYDRWWEARKWWGSIVNQSRNLAIITCAYPHADESWRREVLLHVACLPYVFKNSLRGLDFRHEYSRFLGERVSEELVESEHMPTFLSLRIAKLLAKARENEEMDGFSFLEAEKQRSSLIDAIGACERILKTPIPLVIAINTRRFIFAFLLFLPFALPGEIGWLTPGVIFVIAYALFSLDQIGIELQNPFASDKRSHLPLTSICETIANNVLELDSELCEKILDSRWKT